MEAYDFWNQKITIDRLRFVRQKKGIGYFLYLTHPESRLLGFVERIEEALDFYENGTQPDRITELNFVYFRWNNDETSTAETKKQSIAVTEATLIRITNEPEFRTKVEMSEP